jgi:hypothetical protein
MNEKMVVTIGEYRYERYPNKETGGVNIYVEDTEVDYFTDYSIGDNFDRFEESCQEHYDAMMEEY